MIDSRRRRSTVTMGRIAWTACGLVAAACGSQVIVESAPGGSGGATQALGVTVASGDVGGGAAGCGDGKIEPPEQCDDGPKNGTTGDPCYADCTLSLVNRCGNGKLDTGEECDLGMANSCVDGTTSNCTCTCKNKKCGDGVVQSGECCDDANGGDNEQMSKCTPDCKGCKNPNDPGCKCSSGATSVTTTVTSGGCFPKKLFKTVVSSQLNPVMQGVGLTLPFNYKGFLGAQAGKALCQDVGADHMCTYDEVLAADAKGELAALPTNLTYWLHRTKNAPDYLQNNGMKACKIDADCPPTDQCDPTVKVCAWKPGQIGRCYDWASLANSNADGEWFATLPDKSGGGVAKGSLSFHFYQDAGGVPPPACQDEQVIGCAGPCSATRAILCCYPCV